MQLFQYALNTFPIHGNHKKVDLTSKNLLLDRSPTSTPPTLSVLKKAALLFSFRALSPDSNKISRRKYLEKRSWIYGRCDLCLQWLPLFFIYNKFVLASTGGRYFIQHVVLECFRLMNRIARGIERLALYRCRVVNKMCTFWIREYWKLFLVLPLASKL